MSGRRPLNEGARSVPLFVHSRNSTCATSRGSTKIVPLGGWRPLNGLVSVRSGSSSRLTSASDCSVKPVPDLPAVDERVPVHHPHGQRAEVVQRPPSPGVQPPTTTSCVWTFFTLIQCEARTPGW